MGPVLFLELEPGDVLPEEEEDGGLVLAAAEDEEPPFPGVGVDN
jgi:hypothetical protein